MLKKHDKWALAHLIVKYCIDDTYREAKVLQLRKAGRYQYSISQIRRNKFEHV